MQKQLSLIALATLTLFATSCGGGSSSSTDSTVASATNDTRDTPHGTNLVVSVEDLLTNDTGSNLSITAVSLTSANASLSVLAKANSVGPVVVVESVTLSGSTITYTPATGFVGEATFYYTITSGGKNETEVADEPVKAAVSATTEGMVTVTVGASTIATAPVANDDTYNVTKNGTATFTTASMLANDTDVNDDTLTITKVSLSNPNSLAVGSDASVTLSNGSITYTPKTDFTGTDYIYYTVSDGPVKGENTKTDEGRITVTVQAASSLQTNN